MKSIRITRASRLAMVLLLLAGLVSFSVPAGAQAPPSGSESLSVSPPLIEVDATPGNTVEQKISVDNNTDDERNVAVSVQNFGAQGESGQADLTDEEGPYSLKSWIDTEPASQRIGPRERGEFTIKINVPENPPPGGRFGAILFEATDTADGSGNNLKIIPSVASLVLLKVPGDVVEQASIASFTTSDADETPGEGDQVSDKNFFRSGPIKLHTRIANEGNVQVKPTTKVEIFNVFGSKIAELEAQPGNVLPESVRRFETTWANEQLFGYYKAKTTVTYGATGQTLTAETSFWGAPLGIVLAIVIGLAAVFLLFWLPRKRLKKAFSAFKNA